MLFRSLRVALALALPDKEEDRRRTLDPDTAASDYSPYREPGNGKTWLEQVLQITEKPRRQRHPVLRGRIKGDNNGTGTNTATGTNTGHTPSSSDNFTNKNNSGKCQARTVRTKRPQAPPLLPFINGMSEKEISIVRKLLTEISKYTSTFCCGFSEPDAWKKSVKYNRATNDDEFYPDVSQLMLLFSFVICPTFSHFFPCFSLLFLRLFFFSPLSFFPHLFYFQNFISFFHFFSSFFHVHLFLSFFFSLKECI